MLIIKYLLEKTETMTKEERLLNRIVDEFAKDKGTYSDFEKNALGFINQFKSGQIIIFNKWLSDNHSSFEIPDRVVQEYIKWNIVPD